MEERASVSGRCQFCNAQLSLVQHNGSEEEDTDDIVDSCFRIFNTECRSSDANPPSSSSSGAKKEVEVGSDEDSYVLLDAPREPLHYHGSWSVADVTVMNKVLDICSRLTGIQQPLCADCSCDLYRELQQGIDEMGSSKEAYQTLCMKLSERLEHGDGVPGNGEEDLAQELVALEHECSTMEKEVGTIREDIERAVSAREQLASIEDRYWLAYNTLMLNLHDAADLRDVLQSRMEASETAIEKLRHTHVLSELFKISVDGPFGTISGLRLGSTPETPVQWWEINSAWGQAVMLLDIISNSLELEFNRGQTLWEPHGSFSRVYEQGRGYSDLYGPVNKILCLGYDRAQSVFLECLKEVAGVLAKRGVSREGTAFALKYPIDGDRVGGHSIRYGLARDKAWTKALKYMLCDLQSCLKGTLDYMDSCAINVSGLAREKTYQ